MASASMVQYPKLVLNSKVRVKSGFKGLRLGPPGSRVKSEEVEVRVKSKGVEVRIHPGQELRVKSERGLIRVHPGARKGLRVEG